MPRIQPLLLLAVLSSTYACGSRGAPTPAAQGSELVLRGVPEILYDVRGTYVDNHVVGPTSTWDAAALHIIFEPEDIDMEFRLTLNHDDGPLSWSTGLPETVSEAEWSTWDVEFSELRRASETMQVGSSYELSLDTAQLTFAPPEDAPRLTAVIRGRRITNGRTTDETVEVRVTDLLLPRSGG